MIHTHMAKVKLTPQRIAAFSLEEGKQQQLLFDSEVKGLGVRVTSGSKSYIFQLNKNSKLIRLTIGDVTNVLLDVARQEARRLGSLAAQGIDIRQAKKEQAQQQDHAQKLNQSALTIFEEYIQDKSQSWGERSLRDNQKMIEPPRPRLKGDGLTNGGILRPLLACKLHELDQERVKAWSSKEQKIRPTQCALAFRLLRAFLNWCETQQNYKGVVEEGLLNGIGKAVNKSNAKNDVLQREQLKLWFAAVKKINNIVISAYLQTTLISGRRREEVMGLRWSDIDFQWCSISIKDKVDGVSVIPLTPYLRSLLESLPRRNEWVFSSPSAKNGRLQEPRIAHNKAALAAGLPHLTIHGLRRSFGSLCEWCEVPSGIVAQLQGHKPSALVERHYRVRPLDLLREWHTKIEAWIIKEGGVNFDYEEKERPKLRVIGE